MASSGIFLSHSSTDGAWCEVLRASAEELGIEMYLAEHDQRAGESLAAKVQDAIKRCDAVLVLISDTSASSPYVHQEIGYALRCDKLVIPLVQPGIPPPSLGMLEGLEYIPFDFGDPLPGLGDLRVRLTDLIREQEQQRQQTAALALAAVALVVLVLTSD